MPSKKTLTNWDFTLCAVIPKATVWFFFSNIVNANVFQNLSYCSEMVCSGEDIFDTKTF